MPVQVVRSLEQEDWQKLGAPVFVRGQLRSYARLLNVDLGPLIETAQIAPIEPVTLVSHTHTPRLRRLMESTARKAVYVVMTGVLAVPAWYAARGYFGPEKAPTTASLDVVPASALPAETAVAANAGSPAATPAPAPAAKDATPYIASMAPVPRGNATVAASDGGGHGLSLRFNGDSWMQVTAPDGTPIEKALVKAGEQRSYDAGTVGKVVLGNASAVEVQQAGSIVDVKPFQRANVARFAVSSDGSVVPASE